MTFSFLFFFFREGGGGDWGDHVLQLDWMDLAR